MDMIVNMNTRFQIASICFFIVLLINYSRYRKVKLKSTKLYQLLLAAVTVELLFDVITVITVNNLDTIPADINRICHQVFIGPMADPVLSCQFVCDNHDALQPVLCV